MWDLHHEVLTLVGADHGADVVLAGYNVQDDTRGRGAQPVGGEGITAHSLRVSGPLSAHLREGLTVVHDGVIYEIDGRIREYRGGVLDHAEFTITERFPAHWLTDVVVHRAGDRDRLGNPVPGEKIPVTGCLVRWHSTEERVDHSDLTSGRAVLYRRRRPGDTFTFRSTDLIEVPTTALITGGKWAVDGEPMTWPFSTEVQLTKE